MEQQNRNQERGRKRGRRGVAAPDSSEPSRAPGQDQDVKSIAQESAGGVPRSYANETAQGISNRPANEEHAFPKSKAPVSDDLDIDPKVADQSGGNRGGV
jgi:hypothetical protein